MRNKITQQMQQISMRAAVRSSTVRSAKKQQQSQRICTVTVRVMANTAPLACLYTTTEKQDSYPSLENILDKHCADATLKACIKELLDGCADITEALRSALVTVGCTDNSFGDKQLSADAIVDNRQCDLVKSSPTIAFGASEEEPVMVKCSGSDYTVCWDPLDGSSIVDNNSVVGTIVMRWSKNTAPATTACWARLAETKCAPWSRCTA